MSIAEPRRLAFRVEYDGTDFHGWQAQASGVPTIQQALEAAIGDLAGAEVQVDGASRTDAGVHALDQLAATTFVHPIALGSFAKAVNKRLPGSVAIRDPEVVDADFSPRFASRGKTYQYRIYVSRLRRPLIDRTHWRVPHELELERLAHGIPHLVGRRDFTSFAARDGSHRTTERSIRRLEVVPAPDHTLCIRVEGDAFMKHMVRNLVGTLVNVARGHTSPERLVEILAARDRCVAGPTAPARGLTLERVYV